MGLRHEWAAARHLRSHATLARAALSRDTASVLSPRSIIGIAGYWTAGLWTSTVTHYYLVWLPVTVPAVLLGRAINHRLHGDAFLKYVYISLAIIGSLLLAQALAGHV